MGNELENKVLNYKRYLEANQDGEKIPRIFNKLLEMPITVNILQNTGIGKVVNGFRKREGDVGRKAKIIVSTWKDLVAQEQLRLEAENEVLETGNENYSNDCSPVSEEDRQLSENDAGSVKSDYSNDEDYNVPKNFSDKENLNRSKKHDHSHGKRENNSRHTDHDHSHEKKDKRHRHEEKKDKHKERTEKIKSSHSERQKNPTDKYGEKCADDGKSDSDSNRLERKNSESHSDSEKTKNNKHEYKNREHSGSEHGKYSSKSEHRKDSDSEHGRSSKSEHKKDSKSEHGKYSSKSEHRKDSKSEHGKDSDSEHGRSSKSEHKKDSKSEHGKGSKSKHGKDSKSEHGKDSKSEHRKDSKSENGKYSTSEQNKHSSRDTHISSPENKNHSNSENKEHSDSEYRKHLDSENRKHSDSEHRKHSNSESSRKSDKKHESSKYSNSESESRNKHSSSKHEHKSRSEHKYDDRESDKKKKNGDHRAESDANGDTKSDDKTENFKSEKYQKHESRSDREEIHSTNVEAEMESLDSELNGFDGQNHIASPAEDRNIFDRLVNGKTDEKPIKKTDEVQSSHVTHKGDSKSKSEGSSSRSHSSSSRSHSSHKEKESSSKSHHSVKKEDEKKAESLSEKSNSRHSAEDKDSSRSKHKDSSRSSKHGSSKDKSRSHKSDEKSKSKHSDDKSRHSSKSEKSSHKTKHSSSKDKKSKEPAVEFLAFDESGVTKKRDVDYEQLKSKFKIKKKGEPSQKLLAPSKDFPVKKRKNEEQDSPVASKMAKSDKSALYEELYNLPAPQTHYRPWRYSQLEDKKSSADEFSDEGNFWTKNTTRTAVYSGRKQQYVPKMYSLYEICLQSLMNNIDGLDYVGGVPFDIMKPILEKCTPAQLYRLEDCNPVFLEDTDYLWKRHCDKEFKNTEPDEFESWREMYWRKSDEREEKLLSLKSTITQSMAQKLPVKTTKLAYVDSAAKPPRDVRRQQIKFGTAGPSSGERMKKFSHLMEPVAISRPTQMKRVAPMMQKTLTMMKKIRR